MHFDPQNSTTYTWNNIAVENKVTIKLEVTIELKVWNNVYYRDIEGKKDPNGCSSIGKVEQWRPGVCTFIL